MATSLIRFGWLATEVDVRNSSDTDYPLMSVSQYKGVIPRAELMGNSGRAESLDNYKICKPGDLVINRMSASSGALGLARESGLVSPDYAVLRPTPLAYGPFLTYLMKSDWFVGEMTARLRGIGAGGESASVRTPRINIADLKDVIISLPSLTEQRRIADYLDEQSAKLDEILQAKRRYIEKIRELYLRSIGKITSGLESASNSLLSGWQVQRISWNFKTGSGTTPTSSTNEFFDGTIPWVNSGDLNDGLVTESSKYVTELAIQTFSALKVYQPGALLVAMYGATVGKTALLGVSACVNQAVCVLEPTGEVLPEYARYWFFANRSALMDQSVGGGQPNINQDILRSQRISFPDKETQEILITQLNDETQKHLEMTLLVERSIDQIIDFKTSLITAAVTGTFDTTIGRSVA